jgi:cardiolipin synthase
MADWHDLHARFEGETTKEVSKDFTYIWKQVHNSNAPPPAENREGEFEYVIARPFHGHYPIYHELLKQIAAAQKTIYMTTPYYLPPRKLQQALRVAVARGVDVQIVVTRKSDVPVAVSVSSSYFPKWIRQGIKIFSFQPTVWHGKYAIIDDKWAMIGSTNLDYLSLLKNREANLLIKNADVIEKMRENFASVLQQCRQISSDDWSKEAFYFKLIGYCGRCVKKIM